MKSPVSFQAPAVVSLTRTPLGFEAEAAKAKVTVNVKHPSPAALKKAKATLNAATKAKRAVNRAKLIELRKQKRQILSEFKKEKAGYKKKHDAAVAALTKIKAEGQSIVAKYKAKLSKIKASADKLQA